MDGEFRRGMVRAACVGLLLTGLLGAVGCVSTSGSTRARAPEALRTLKRGSARAPAGDRVIRTAGELADLWSQAGLKGSPPEVDFSSSLVVATFRGCLPSSCYDTRVVGFTRGGGGTAWIEDVDPEPACVCGPTITCPFHIVAVGRVEGEVAFHHRPTRAECRRQRRP